jgi:hypothetical protein
MSKQDILSRINEIALAVAPASVKLSYGTAGFRSAEADLDAVFLRMGMLAALRAMQTDKVRPNRGLYDVGCLMGPLYCRSWAS